jgi:hypothetical protein
VNVTAQIAETTTRRGSEVPDWWPHQRLIVLADDAGHRALPVRLRRHPVKLWRVFSHPDDRD